MSTVPEISFQASRSSLCQPNRSRARVRLSENTASSSSHRGSAAGERKVEKKESARTVDPGKTLRVAHCVPFPLFSSWRLERPSLRSERNGILRERKRERGLAIIPRHGSLSVHRTHCSPGSTFSLPLLLPSFFPGSSAHLCADAAASQSDKGRSHR